MHSVLIINFNQMGEILGKLRKEDVPIIKDIVAILKEFKLNCGLHGTSLWNSSYKDVDLLVFSNNPTGLVDFRKAIQKVSEKFPVAIGKERGNDKIGLDLDLNIDNGKIYLHLSYVVLL
jgi:hypothetical protein